MVPFHFKIKDRDKKTNARCGVIQTAHGQIMTPAFIPVGTQASVKSLSPQELREVGIQMFFVNTYHMYLRPGLEVVKKFGGLHTFMAWDGPIITDSGGFQIFSMGAKRFALKNEEQHESPSLVSISDNGVEFRSHWDGSKHMFTPEVSMEYQWILGSDIHVAFDDCTPYPVTHEKAEMSLMRTHRWAMRSLEAHQKYQISNIPASPAGRKYQKYISNIKSKSYQALYGSIQGSVYEDLRKSSAKFISSMDFDGLAIGGVAIGESKAETEKILKWVTPLLPDNKPRHLLGVGEIDDIFTLVEQGIDTFDCVQPTRLARMGHVYTKSKVKRQKAKVTDRNSYTIDITKAICAKDMKPIDTDCSCYTCQHFSCAYIHHLFKVRELLAYRLATIHNIFFVTHLIYEIRRAISDGTFLDLKAKWLYDI